MSDTTSHDVSRCLDLLHRWAAAAERYWQPVRSDAGGQPALGCYGTGYNAWGVQTNQKYLGAMAVLATQHPELAEAEREQWRDRAMQALRFSLASHVSAAEREDGVSCLDNTRWGHTWISALGVERMMHGVQLLEPYFTQQDHAALQRMLVSESEWLLTDYHRGKDKGIKGNVWNHQGGNDPESNIWNGSILWRTAQRYPDHLHAQDWEARTHRFLMTGVSTSEDVTNETLIAGRPVKDWCQGPCFFPNFALDHHGYLNVGYMVICVSNVAMLHFDLKAAGHDAPESLHWRQKELWQVLRRMIFSDGRLARIGGDTRVRYAYCQEYLLPSLMYAADHLGDAHALPLISRALDWMSTERDTNEDGSFYASRLAELVEFSPYYYTRLESDRASALGMVVAYDKVMSEQQKAANRPAVDATAQAKAYEQSVAGNWLEPEHGGMLHRCPTRLASFSWRACDLAQGMCQPPDDGHLAEWTANAAGIVEPLHYEFGATTLKARQHRQLLAHTQANFDGGFVTCGSIMEGCNVVLAEGWRGSDLATHHITFAALPDGQTVIGLQLARVNDRRAYLKAIKGLHLNVPNDLFNGFERRLITADGEHQLVRDVFEPTQISLNSRWANVDHRLGAVGLYGADDMTLSRSPQRRGGTYRSLHCEQICWPCVEGTQSHDAGSMLMDAGWAILSSVNAEQTAAFADLNHPRQLPHLPHDVRGVTIQALDDHRYTVIANFSDIEADLPASAVGGPATDLATGESLTETVGVPAGTAVVLRLA